MKKLRILLILEILLLMIVAFTSVHAKETETSSKKIVISKMAVDISGDRRKDQILLTGIRHSKRSVYFKKITLEITSANHKTDKVNLGSGAAPILTIADYNNDGINDLLFTVRSRDVTNLSIFTFKDFERKTLMLPEPLQMDSIFFNNYRAKIKIKLTGDTYLFDLTKRKGEYERLGIFSHGKLNEPTELTVHPYHSWVAVNLVGKEKGIKGRQKITGAFSSDTIAYVDSIWCYQAGEWRLLKTIVLK